MLASSVLKTASAISSPQSTKFWCARKRPRARAPPRTILCVVMSPLPRSSFRRSDAYAKMIPESSSIDKRLNRSSLSLDRGEREPELFNLGDQFLVTAAGLLHDLARRTLYKRSVIKPGCQPARFVRFALHLLGDALAFLFEVD